MKHYVAVLCIFGALLAACWSMPVVSHAATSRDTTPAFVITTLSGNVYAPNGTGTVTSPGVANKRLTLTISLSGMPAPTTVGGTDYKVWLVDPDSATVMPGGLLSYHADGTVDGTISTLYRYFTVIAVTAEKNLYGPTPENPTILQGSVNYASMQTALAYVTPRVVVGEAPLPAAYISASPKHVLGVTATGRVILASKARTWTIRAAAVTPTSIILLMPVSDPHGSLWVSGQGAGTFKISAASVLPAAVQLRYVVINS